MLITQRGETKPSSLDDRLDGARKRLDLAITRCNTLLVYVVTGAAVVLLVAVVGFLVAQLLQERNLGAWLGTVGRWASDHWSELPELVKVITGIASLGAMGAGGRKLHKRRGNRS